VSHSASALIGFFAAVLAAHLGAGLAAWVVGSALNRISEDEAVSPPAGDRSPQACPKAVKPGVSGVRTVELRNGHAGGSREATTTLLARPSRPKGAVEPFVPAEGAPLAGSSRWQKGGRLAAPGQKTRGLGHASSREASAPFVSNVSPSNGSGLLARLRGSRRSPFSDPQPPEAA
jgi:hypothetical protein